MKGFLWCPHCGAPHSLNAQTCPKTGARLQTAANKPFGAARLERGTLLARRYQIERPLGEESVSRLYDAVQVSLGRRVVVKHLSGEGLAREDVDAELLEMEREARAAAAVEHPNVVEVLDFRPLTEQGRALLVRPCASRERLSTRLRMVGALGADEAGDIVVQLLSGLQALHATGIVHRDVGAHNVALVERAGCRPLARLAGLGRCAWGKLEAPRDLPLGVHYTSPEVLRGEPADARSDVYSCGVLLFEMLGGRRPFEAANAAAVRAAILAEPAPPLSSLARSLDRAWLDVVTRALAKDPQARFPTARAFQEALPMQTRATVRSRPLADDSQLAVASLRESQAPSSSSAPMSRRDVPGTPCDARIGRVLARKYLIESLLGSGSSGAVYRATHVDLQRPVAVKLLHERNRTSQQFAQRFKAEALAASKLDHPNVTRVVDFGSEADGSLYLVMEFVEGQSLQAKLEAEGRMAPREALDIALQITDALVAAHHAGVIHRDIKPENILLVADADGASRSLCVKVCDFGLAKLHQRDPEGSELTAHGLVLGSPAYMAPEQVLGLPCDQRADVYGVGVTLFEMLTGRLPLDADTIEQLFVKKVDAPAARLSSVLAIDPLLDDVVARALERDLTARHASAQELRLELIEAFGELEQENDSARAVSIWPDPVTSRGS